VIEIYFAHLKKKKCKDQLKPDEPCNDYAPGSDDTDGSNYMVMCPGGTMCIERRSSPGEKCLKVYNKGFNEECEDDYNCAYGLSCTGFPRQCRRVVDGLCPNSGNKNCTRDEICVCGESGQPNECKPSFGSQCGETQTMLRWNSCWERNNCPLERSMFLAFYIDIFQKETCLGKFCGDIPQSFICCRLKSFEGLNWTPAGASSLFCGSPAGPIFSVLLGIGLIVSQVVLVAGIITYIYFRNRFKSNYGEF